MQPIPQPAKGILALRRITNVQVAAAANLSHHYVGRVLNGWQAPSAEFRSAVADLVGLPESALFRDDWFQAEAVS